jgi:hypothetical protein
MNCTGHYRQRCQLHIIFQAVQRSLKLPISSQASLQPLFSIAFPSSSTILQIIRALPEREHKKFYD